MIVISSAELRGNLKKYLDLAKTENVIIQRGKTETFHLTAERVLEPDEDFYNAITAEELLVGIKQDIAELFKNRAKK